MFMIVILGPRFWETDNNGAPTIIVRSGRMKILGSMIMMESGSLS